MAKLLMKVKGFDGEVELMNDRVVILRSGVFNMFKYGLNSKREIPLAAISEVMFKPPVLLGMGSIEFVRSGRSADEKKNAANSIVKFKKTNAKQFEMLKEKVFELINQLAQKHT
ncbi:MAG: DUF4429 domain-containing protein [Rickettsiales bacterium]|jgi:hypothetical protein|nr:DUF4429 domain-containing protein [Rickettsiales bacterium]